MTTELKPCPFCGGNFVAQGASRDRISVWCSCGARGPDVAFPENCDPLPPIRKCHAAWNTRAPSPAVQELAIENGALRKALEGLTSAVGAMRVPQTLADAALQINVTIGPALKRARAALAQEGE